MTELASLTSILTLALAGIWLFGAGILPRLQQPARDRALRALIIAGVPLLGWLTLKAGPIAGLVGLALGMLLLMRRPMRPRVPAVPPAPAE